MSTSTAVNTFGSIHMGSLMFQNLVSGSTSSLVNNVSNSIGVSGGATASLVSEIAVQGALNQRSPQIPSLSYPYIYVNKSGNDNTGNGSFSSPLLTVLAAQNLAGTFYPTITSIYIGPGTYVESSPLNIKPNTNYIGSGRATTVIANLGLGDSGWNDPTGAGANQLIFQDINLQNQTVAGTTLNFNGASAVGVNVQFQNTQMSGTYRLVSSTDDIQNTTYFFRQCQISGTTFGMIGGNVVVTGTNVFSVNTTLSSAESTSFQASFLSGTFSPANATMNILGSTAFVSTFVIVALNNCRLPDILNASTCSIQLDLNSVNTLGTINAGNSAVFSYSSWQQSSIFMDVFEGTSGSTTGNTAFSPWTSNVQVGATIGNYGVGLVNMVPAADNYLGVSFGVQPPGRYALCYQVVKGSDRGVLRVMEQNTGTTLRADYDMFQAGITTGTFVKLTDYFTWSQSGNMEIRWIVPSKNASSTNFYTYLINTVELQQTI